MMQAYASEIHRCFRCGYCKFPSDFTDFNCPAYSRFRLETYSPGGRLWLIWAWLKKEIEWSVHLAEIMYSCATCRSCVEQCPMKFGDDLVDWMVAARSDMIEEGLALPDVRDFLDNLNKHGNPWGIPRTRRDEWAEGIRRYKPGDDYLLYVGCAGSYEDRGQRMARNLAELLDRTGISFGILGSAENCDGNEAYMLGEMGLFNQLATDNVRKFKELGVKRVVTLSPHAYNSMKNKYPRSGEFEVLHYTQLLSRMIKTAKIKPFELSYKVTYHDPCFLGRFNGIYDAPREILKSIPGIELVEMERNREDSFCCGGGSGNFVMDHLGRSQESPSRIRAKEAHKTGAEILVVSCPSCMMMLEDAVEDEELRDELRVKTSRNS